MRVRAPLSFTKAERLGDCQEIVKLKIILAPLREETGAQLVDLRHADVLGADQGMVKLD